MKLIYNGYNVRSFGDLANSQFMAAEQLRAGAADRHDEEDPEMT